MNLDGKRRVSAKELLACTSTEAISRLGGGADRLTVGAVLVCDLAPGPRILVLRRALSEEEYGGIEELPSGAVDAKESLREALSREVKEECGLIVRDFSDEWFIIRYVTKKGKTIQVNFFAPILSGLEIVLDPREHDLYRWVAREDISESDLTDNIKLALNEVSWSSLLRRAE